MPKYDRSRTAIVLSGLGAILLMASVYLVFRINLPRLIGIIPMVIAGCAMTGYYRYNQFLLKPEPDDPERTRKAVTLFQYLAFGALGFGWLVRLVDFSDWKLVWALDLGGLIVMVYAMTMLIMVRLERFYRRSG